MFVNGVAVCNPVEIDLPLEPVAVHLRTVANAPGRVEFRHFSLWSKANVPTPHERWQLGQVPLRAAPETDLAPDTGD